jgi:tetratricopeptide (TPR) repeat protein
MMSPLNNFSAPASSAPSRSAAFGLSSSDFRRWTLDVGLLTSLLLALTTLGATIPAPAPEPAPPSTPREFYNAGTRQLGAGKLREAEAFLESALASQNQRLQPPALYNLGLVRFGQGVEQLKKSPPAKPTATRGQAIARQADDAIRQANEALGGNDVQKMVAAYLRGRGTRKELKAATEAVRRALQVHGVALARWERALGDFKSTLELNSPNSDARHNAEVVDRCIAKLVDSLRELQQCANGMGGKKEQLGEALKKLKGRIPAPDMPPGAAGDDEEDEEQPFGPQPGQEEGPSKDGKEMPLSPEQAGWLLEAYRLDSERRLPMGQGPAAEPKDRSRPTW